MSLSKKSKAVAQTSGLSTDLCRLVGEFVGADLPLLPRMKFYDMEVGGHTYVRASKRFGFYTCMVGKNLHLNEWIVKKRTPKSYVVQYSQSIIVCESELGVTYKFHADVPEHKNKVKRIFPFRRKMQTALILKKLSEKSFITLSGLLCTSNNDFYLDFQR